ncbi:CLAVATA3/ESR (CLE)-related protein 9 [Capsicum chinense]|nr:CLAVATA3/ESR (CLE)-related protein 9 [Capsicum chinense]
MKAAHFPSSSSKMACKCMLLAYLIFFSFSTVASSTKSQEFPLNQDHPHSTSSSSSSSVICYQLHRIRHCPPFPPPPSPSSSSSSLDEIDPRYGVEKRLVPSGPNPLHN